MRLPASIPEMHHSTLAQLDRGSTRRLIATAILRVAVSVALLLGLYAIAPTVDEANIGAIVGLLIGLALAGALLVWQFRQVIDAEHPEVRAVIALVSALTVLIVVFAYTYLSVSHSNPASFSQPLDRIGSIYFTVTVLGTVGFGDIVARTQLARVLVSIQIVLDLVFVVAVARTFVVAARIGIGRRQEEPTADG
jgi:voltage-gated potassium channel